MVAPWKVRATGDSPGGMVADAAELRKGLALLADPDGFCQVVGLPSAKSSTLLGSDVDGLVEAVKSMPAGFGVYLQMNPVREGLSSKARKSDVVRRRWVYIDVDPSKAEGHKNHSATDAEKDGALAVAGEVMEHLTAAGWPAPAVVDSGNGFALFYRADLGTDDHTQAVYRRLLGILADTFSGRAVIDRAVHNADRLVKVPGTWARKGPADIADRPHRVCRVLYVPTELIPVTADQLALVAGVEQTTPQPVPSVSSPSPFTVRASANGDGAAAYGRRALDMECARVFTTPAGAGRNNALNRAAFSLGQLVAGKVLLRQEVESRLTCAARQAGLDADENCGERGIRATVRSGLEAGMLEPRGVPERNGIANGKHTTGSASAADTIPAGERVILWASEVTPRKVEWLWPDRIPLDKLTTFAGNGGLGKTFVLCDIVSRVSRGSEWPDQPGVTAKPGKCLFISGEDDPDDTLVPRMIECGADLSRVAFLRMEALDKFTLADLKTLDRAMAEMGPDVRFVAIDPPTAYLGGVNDHKNAELRSLLTPLMLWSRRHHVATVFNNHVNKPQGAKVEASMRVMGSVAWVNAVRSAYMFAMDPNDQERRLFVGMKSNLAKQRLGLAYKIVSVGECARVEWLGEVDVTADEAMNREQSKRKRSVKAGEWLEELFADCSELPSKKIWDAKAATSLSDDALKEAKEEMGIRAMQKCDDQGKRQWFWYWTPEAREVWQRTVRESEGQPEGQ
jgi:putative DNA primase/helicase